MQWRSKKDNATSVAQQGDSLSQREAGSKSGGALMRLGCVRYCRTHRETGQVVAIKIVDLEEACVPPLRRPPHERRRFTDPPL